MRSLIVIFTSFAVLAIFAAGAAAQSGSEFDQYVPDLSDGGNEAPLPDALNNGDNDSGDGDGGGAPPTADDTSSGAASSPGHLDELSGKGPEGETVARVAGATAPERAGSVDEIPLADSEGVSPGSSLFDLLGGPTGGIGAWFPLVLVITLGIAVVYAVRRRRV